MNHTTYMVNKAAVIDLKEITQEILGSLDARSRDIVTRRFGLEDKEPETLEAIGKQYGITRERVRQIETNAKKAMAELKEKLAPVDELLKDIFVQFGGLLSEGHIARLAQEATKSDVSPNVVRFYLEILPGYTYITKSSVFHPHWSHEGSRHDRVEYIVEAAKQILKHINKPQFFNELAKAIKEKLSANEQELLEQYIEAALIASKDVDITTFNEWGLTQWAETSPRGVADKAYTVLRHHKKPAHFREITTLINSAHFDERQANSQTVHNELIKDNRFVLVGRGLYGLKEWGYITGTVADVLESILRDAKKAMSKEELMEEVLKQRIVKKNTIVLSLQNINRFTKVDKNLYTLKTK